MGSDQSTARCIRLAYRSDHVLIARPLSYEDALAAAKEHFPQLSQKQIAFQTDQLAICGQKKQKARISAGAWDTAVKSIDTVEVINLSNGSKKSTAPPPRYSSSGSCDD
ncbi:hypothetical protein BDV98DRAFT_572264 [Pterulicium gracile]|uniref:Uncharacterized protein n=1 Tax=Pterulicium gracile TaxID=1884261 RepID=A0A5C3QCN2_9AGAR|nr:hypothetical protein BDV98DRAFT_572264 [Pterula gracilis]